MQLVLTSTIEYLEQIELVQQALPKINQIAFLPLSMPLEMDNDQEWQSFYGEGGQLRDIYEKPFKSFNKPLLWQNIFTQSKAQIEEMIEASDCVVIVGGDAKALVTRLKEYHLEQVITSGNKLVIGVSAGAKIWFSEMFVEHQDATGAIHLEVTAGLDFFPTKQVIAAHVDFSQAQLTRLHALLKQSDIEEIIALGDDGAITYNTLTDAFYQYGDVKIFQ